MGQIVSKDLGADQISPSAASRQKVFSLKILFNQKQHVNCILSSDCLISRKSDLGLESGSLDILPERRESVDKDSEKKSKLILDSSTPILSNLTLDLNALVGELPEVLPDFDSLNVRHQLLGVAHSDTLNISSQISGPEQKLSVQRPPTTFHLFNNFPIEIRLKIIRMTFPPSRYINLDTEFIKKNSPKFKTKKYLESRGLFLATLHVNKESRSETLLSYCVYFWRDGSYGPESKHAVGYPPLCFDPKVDQLYLTRETLQKLTSFGWNPSPKVIKSITTLEVREWDLKYMQQYDLSDNLLIDRIPGILLSMYGMRGFPIPLNSITQFPSLIKLRFVVREGHDAKLAYQYHERPVMMSCDYSLHTQLEEYFKKSFQSFGGTAPFISFDEWQPLQN